MKGRLTHTVEIPVRFNEVDALGIVWHGHYLQYAEEAREALAVMHQINYLHIHENGYMVPIVKMEVDHKSPLTYGDTMIIEAVYLDSPAAKMIFECSIYNKATKALVATVKSIQVFTDLKGNLQLTYPDFFQQWREETDWE